MDNFIQTKIDNYLNDPKIFLVTPKTNVKTVNTSQVTKLICNGTTKKHKPCSYSALPGMETCKFHSKTSKN